MHAEGLAGLLSEPGLLFPKSDSVALPLMIEGVRELGSKCLKSTMESTTCRMNLKSSFLNVNCLRSRNIRFSATRCHPGLHIALFTQSLCKPVIIAVRDWKLLS